jgi:hypothetical protein
MISAVDNHQRGQVEKYERVTMRGHLHWIGTNETTVQNFKVPDFSPSEDGLKERADVI